MIVSSQSTAEANVNASIVASEDAVKENATAEIDQMETNVAQDISNCTDMLNSAIDTAKADIIANLASVCQFREFKITDAQCKCCIYIIYYNL